MWAPVSWGGVRVVRLTRIYIIGNVWQMPSPKKVPLTKGGFRGIVSVFVLRRRIVGILLSQESGFGVPPPTKSPLPSGGGL